MLILQTYFYTSDMFILLQVYNISSSSGGPYKQVRAHADVAEAFILLQVLYSLC